MQATLPSLPLPVGAATQCWCTPLTGCIQCQHHEGRNCEFLQGHGCLHGVMMRV